MKLEIKYRNLIFDVFDNAVTELLVIGYSKYSIKLINITNSLRIYKR